MAPSSHRNSPHPSRSATICAAWLTLLVLLSGCREEPTEVIEKARDALDNRDDEGFLAMLTPRSAELIREGVQVGKKSTGMFKLLRSGKPTKVLLPPGTLEEPAIDGELCTVLATKGKTKERIILRLVRGRWRIDLLEMASFYEQIKPMDE